MLPLVGLVAYTDVRVWHRVARALVRELRALIQPPIERLPGAIDVYDVLTEQVGICTTCAVWPTRGHVSPCSRGLTFYAPRMGLTRAAQELFLPRVIELMVDVGEEFEQAGSRADCQVAIYCVEDQLLEHLSNLAPLSPAAREAAAVLHVEAGKRRRVELQAARRSLLAVLRSRFCVELQAARRSLVAALKARPITPARPGIHVKPSGVGLGVEEGFLP